MHKTRTRKAMRMLLLRARCVFNNWVQYEYVVACFFFIYYISLAIYIGQSMQRTQYIVSCAHCSVTSYGSSAQCNIFRQMQVYALQHFSYHHNGPCQ